MRLADYLDALSYDIAFWMAGLANPDYRIDQLGGLSTELEVKLRAIGIMALLVRGDNDAFCHNLIRAALARRTYLQRLRAASIVGEHHQGTGRTRAVFDAIAAGQCELAAELVALASPQWMRGDEYEEDFHCGRALGLLCQPLTDVSALEAELDAFEAALDGASDARLGVLRAIARRDRPAFSASFEDLLSARDARIADDRRRGQLEEPHVVAERLVNVEALALLRLAQRAGLMPDPDYRFCPSLARVPMSKPFPGE